ncbi:uncharacterized protein LOC122710281 isoform X4 [Cervus elaphus]|uniref:uncharacterized protein LOC122710281 isoform X4 n=1 Tax=Cervus elaphus TaxID=9860 RepID=UPI001CC273CA|nr:uncharacterized protein LOC122710281 isoform X4 [Cervus elaphus]
MLPAPFAEPEVEPGGGWAVSSRARPTPGVDRNSPQCLGILLGLLRFQQSFVSVSHLHLEKKGLCTGSPGVYLSAALPDVESLGRPHCVHHPGRRGSRHLGGLHPILCIHKLRENVFQEHKTLREKELEMGPKASHSYGRKFGVEQDRMDKSAVGLEYQSKLSKCCLQVDSIWGFGGKFGVQLARVDQLFCSRWLFTRTWEAPRDTQGRTLSAGRFTGHRGHRLGTSPTLGLRAGGDTPQRPPDRLLTPAADRTPWLTQPSHQGRSQN